MWPSISPHLDLKRGGLGLLRRTLHRQDIVITFPKSIYYKFQDIRLLVWFIATVHFVRCSVEQFNFDGHKYQECWLGIRN